jgi:hypothetical protein
MVLKARTGASWSRVFRGLQDIARHTPDTYPDKSTLAAAVGLYTEIASECTRAKKLREQERRLLNNEACS